MTPPDFGDAELTDRAWLQFWMIISILLGTAAMNLVSIPLQPAGTARWMSLVVVVAGISAAVLFLISRRRLQAAAWTQTILLVVMLDLAAWTVGGVRAPSISAQLLIVAVVVIFHGRRAGIIMTGVSVVTVLFMAYAEAVGFLPAVAAVHTPWSRAVVIIGYLVMLAVLQVLLMTTLGRSQRRVIHELAERQRAEQRLVEIIDGAPFGAHAWELRPSGELILVDVNRTAEAILGFDHSPLIGKSIEEAFPPDAENGTADAYRRVAQEGGTYDEDSIVYEDGATSGVFEVHARRTGDRRVTVFFRDVSAERAAAQAVVSARDELELRVEERTAALKTANENLATTNAELVAANRIKDDFLAAMSHELRTPLNSVIGFSGTLESGLAGELNDEQQRQVGMIARSGRHLLELVNEVLDLSRIEQGTLEIFAAEFDIHEAAVDALGMITPIAVQKGLATYCDSVTGPLFVVSDKYRVQQILVNLLTNAVKFTESGSVGIVLASVGDVVELRVVDTGFGISPEAVPHVFERFFQAVPPQGGRHEGTGLGLSLVSRLLEALGGRVTFETEVGVGTTFTVTLPIKAAL